MTALACAPRGVFANKKFLLLCSREHKRKNWLFSNSVKGAKASAMLYSIIETAKVNRINPFDYLVHVFKTAPNCNFSNDQTLLNLLPPLTPCI